MARIDEAIRAAEGALTAAQALPESTDEEKATKATKVAAAQAKVDALKEQKQAIEGDINDAVQSRLPDAKKAERETLARKLGVPVEKLDEELDRLENERRGQQSEVSRLTSDLTQREQELATEKTEREKAQRIAETAREQLRTTLIESAVTSQLISQNVINTEEQSYLEGARNLTSLSEVSVDIEIKDDGTLEVKGEVQGAKEAVEKTREKYPVMFGEAFDVATPTPPGRGGSSARGGGGGKKPAYTPNLAVTGPPRAASG